MFSVHKGALPGVPPLIWYVRYQEHVDICFTLPEKKIDVKIHELDYLLSFDTGS